MESDCAREVIGEARRAAKNNLLRRLRKREACIEVPSGGKVIPRHCLHSEKKNAAQGRSSIFVWAEITARTCRGDNCPSVQPAKQRLLPCLLSALRARCVWRYFS